MPMCMRASSRVGEIMPTSKRVYFFRNFPITNAKRYAKRTGIMQKIGLNIIGSSPFEVPANRFAIPVAK